MKVLVRGKISKENRCFCRNTNKMSNSKHLKNQLLIMVLFITIELPYEDFVSDKVCGSSILSYPTTWSSCWYPVVWLDRLLSSGKHPGTKLMWRLQINVVQGGTENQKEPSRHLQAVYKALRRPLSCQGGVSVAAGGSVDWARGVELP